MAECTNNFNLNLVVHEIKQALFRVGVVQALDKIDKNIENAAPTCVVPDVPSFFEFEFKTTVDFCTWVKLVYNVPGVYTLQIIAFEKHKPLNASWYKWLIEINTSTHDHNINFKYMPPGLIKLNDSSLEIEKIFNRFQLKVANKLLDQNAHLNKFASMTFNKQAKFTLDLSNYEIIHPESAARFLQDIGLKVLGRVNLAKALTTLLMESKYVTSNKESELWVRFDSRPIIFFKRGSARSKSFAFIIDDAKIIRDLPNAIKENLDMN